MNTQTKSSYKEKIYDIAVNTFEITCYMFPLEEWEMEEAEHQERPDGSVRAIVHFDGAAKGGMVISPSHELLEALAANMLGIDEAEQEEKEGALCEIANIICGNTVPLFARNENICYIRPPRIAEEGEDANEIFSDCASESVEVALDEGIIQVDIYYKEEYR